MSIYHYTDLNAVYAIIENHKIRMTDIRFLNDKTEYLQGLSILSEACDNIFNNTTAYSPEFISTVTEWLPLLITELSDFNYSDECIYVASFSRSPDTLSQWRSYGMFALEIDDLELVSQLNSAGIEFLECHYTYNLPDDIEAAEVLLHEKALAHIYTQWLSDDPTNANATLYVELKERVSVLATIFKHYCFAEEEEVRLVKVSKSEPEQIQFRVKNNIIIPYYEHEISPEMITSVRIGPLENQDTVEQALVIYAANRMERLYKEGVNIEYLLEVECSDTPYRTL